MILLILKRRCSLVRASTLKQLLALGCKQVQVNAQPCFFFIPTQLSIFSLLERIGRYLGYSIRYLPTFCQHFNSCSQFNSRKTGGDILLWHPRMSHFTCMYFFSVNSLTTKYILVSTRHDQLQTYGSRCLPNIVMQAKECQVGIPLCLIVSLFLCYPNLLRSLLPTGSQGPSPSAHLKCRCMVFLSARVCSSWASDIRGTPSTANRKAHVTLKNKSVIYEKKLLI